MKIFIILACAALTLAGCADPRNTRMAEGAGVGALVAGVPGAAVGAVAADVTRPRHAGRHCYYSQTLEHRVCRYR